MSDTPVSTPSPTPVPEAENLDTLLRQQGEVWLGRQWIKAGAYLAVLITGWLLKHGFDQTDAASITPIVLSALGALALAGWELLQSWTQHNTVARNAGFVAQAARDVARAGEK